MATLEDLQQQLQLLKAQIDALTTPPNEYYTLLYSGEEVDELLGREGSGTVKTVAGVGPDDDGNVPLTASSVKAAPDGYGLGGGATILTSADDLNNIWECGFYGYTSGDMPQNAVAASWLNIMRVESSSSGAFVQTVYGITNNESYQITPIARRMIYSDKITPWEYVNPPMMPGVEYRTIERYQGKPVYVKLINCGAFPNVGTVKMVDLGITNLRSIVRHYETCEVSGLPLMADTNSTLLVRCVDILGSAASKPCVRLHCNLADAGDYYQATVAVYYTKTTD